LAAAPATAPPARNSSTCCGVSTTCRASQNWLAPSGARESCEGSQWPFVCGGK
jgi:hypothetical protein